MISALTGEAISDPLLMAERAAAQQRRRAIKAVLDPQNAINYCHIERAIDLAIEADVTVKATTPGNASANEAMKTVWTPPILGDTEFAAYVHELGHIARAVDDANAFVVEDEDGQTWRSSLNGECAAWEWAVKALGFRWNTPMQREMERCLRSYQPSVVKTIADLQALERTLADGEEAARHIVRISATRKDY